ncbi:MAG: hypothetical protein ACJ8FY_16055 [Gemmataceae bacterium]
MESKVAKKKKDLIPTIIVPPNATLRQMYAALKRDFSAADLQKFTEIEPGIPGEKLVGQLEAIHRAESKKRRKL